MNSITHHAPTQSHAVNSRSCGYFTTSNLLLLYSEKVKVPTVSLIAMFQKLSKIVLFSRKKTVAGFADGFEIQTKKDLLFSFDV